MVILEIRSASAKP